MIITDIKVARIDFHSGMNRSADIIIVDDYFEPTAKFSDLPSDFQDALHEWVNSGMEEVAQNNT